MAVSTTDTARLLEEWAAENLINFSRYEHMPTELQKALPMVICEIQSDERQRTSVDIPELSGFQQALVRVRRADLLLMSHPEPSWTASQALYDAVDELAKALIRDSTLGGRVTQASKFYTASYSPPELQHADGTRARVATFRISIGELVEVTQP